MQEEINEEVIDSLEDEVDIIPQQYTVSSYGADYDVRGLVDRLNEGKIYIPEFQRNYVWKQTEASRLIESLLLGLPIPGIFLAKESEENKLLVIDGQQRLKTLQFFYNGYFNPSEEGESQRVFKLREVQEQFVGKTYKELDEKDRNKLDDSIIHATIIKQESPADGDTSLYHIFERLNNGGVNLNPQEIRVALFHGKFIDFINELNHVEAWRQIYGTVSKRLKDQELILRFLALYFNGSSYKKPLKEFLNKFVSSHRNPDTQFLSTCQSKFTDTINLVHKVIGANAFRPERALNATVFDSVMVGLANRLDKNKDIDESRLKEAYDKLLDDPELQELLTQATSNESNIEKRLMMATVAFADI